MSEGKLQRTDRSFTDLGEGCSYRPTPNDNVKNDISFKSVVQKHFVKEKLFNLVTDLLQSIEDEKQAQKDLIESFKTAREVTGPIREQSAHCSSRRLKRRRKRSDSSLLERITQHRIASNVNLEDVHIYNKERAKVGEMKVSSKQEDANSQNDGDSWTEREQNTTEDGSLENGESHEHKDKHMNLSEKMFRCRSLPVGETEKLMAVYQLGRDKNKDEIDHLVLDLVLKNNVNGEDTSKDREDEDQQRKRKMAEREEKKREWETNDKYKETVEVESSCESDEDEGKVKVVGSNDDFENVNYYDDSDHFDDDDDEFRRLSDPNYELSTVDQSRVPASIEPGLDPIAEASRESFQSMHLSSRESSSVIEIQSRRSKNGWITRNSASETTKLQASRGSAKTKDSGRISKHCADGARNTKADRNRHDTNSANVRRTASKDTERKTEYEKHGEVKINPIYYSNSSSDEQTKTAKCSLKDRKNASKSAEEVKQRNEQSSIKKSKQSKKVISIDLLGVYEDNEDLQRVSRSEINPPRHETVSASNSARKSSKSPKSASKRSRSPRKKRDREPRKYDMIPLPPKLLSSRQSHHIPNYAVSQPKNELISTSRSSNGSSVDDLSESYRSFQNSMVEKRYKQPDSVLWNHLDLTEGISKSRHDFNIGREGEANGHAVVWKLPIHEAIRNVKSAKKIPEIRELSDSTPREERVGKLYIDLKHERRSARATEYRRLEVRRRDSEDFESTHL